jgi:phosphatidate cytidylyltransferase
MTEERTGKGKPMTDDTWRRDDEEDEPLFGEHEPTRDHEAVDDGLTFGASDTGSLPHWTEPPTGELPRLGREGDVVAADALGDDDELDVWSSFTSESPVWKDDSPTEPGPDAVPGVRRTGQHDVVPGEHDITVPREPSRITIGTDPSGMPRRPPVQTGRRRGGQPAGRPVSSPRAGSQPSNRNMPVATAVRS